MCIRDRHTPNLNQAIIDQFLRRDLLDSHVQSIIPGYRCLLYTSRCV